MESLETIYSRRPLADTARIQATTGEQKQAGHGAFIDAAGVANTEGKMKTSKAQVLVVPGHGRITVNGVPYDEYFRDLNARAYLLEPMFVAGAQDKYDIKVNVEGGGVTSQAKAARTGIARALVLHSASTNKALHVMSKWDGRVVERKKPNRAKARRGYTWVKR